MFVLLIKGTQAGEGFVGKELSYYVYGTPPEMGKQGGKGLMSGGPTSIIWGPWARYSTGFLGWT